MEGEKGFTLVEVLITVSLLGLGITAFLQGSALTVRLHRQGRAISTALTLAQERMELLGGVGWDKATEGLPEASLAPLPVAAVERYQELVEVSGRRYLLVLERETGSLLPDLWSVSCFWEESASGFTGKDSLRLWTRRSRLP